MVFAGFDIFPWYFGLQGHLVLALSRLVLQWGPLVHRVRPEDTSKDQPKLLESKAESNTTPHDYIQDILREAPNEWSGLINHPFPRDLAKGTAPLNGFRHHSIQDATHFEHFYRVRMEAIARTGTFQEIQEFAKILSGGLDRVTKARDECATLMGVPKDVVAREPNSKALQDFIDLTSSVANRGDYLDTIITLLPGILAYDHIANEIHKDPDTVRNTLYFNLFVVPYAQNPIKKHITFVNTHIARLSQEERERRWKGWIDTFKKGCIYETDFFSLGSKGFPAYEVVSNGTYKIRSYRRGNPYLVSKGYFSVITQEAEPQEEGIWKLTNSPEGYMIENVAQKGFLSMSLNGLPRQAHGVHISQEDYRWSINPVKVRGQNGPYKAYQLLVPEKMQYVLDTSNNESEVCVEDNAQRSTQLWLLERVKEQE